MRFSVPAVETGGVEQGRRCRRPGVGIRQTDMNVPTALVEVSRVAIGGAGAAGSIRDQQRGGGNRVATEPAYRAPPSTPPPTRSARFMSGLRSDGLVYRHRRPCLSPQFQRRHAEPHHVPTTVRADCQWFQRCRRGTRDKRRQLLRPQLRRPQRWHQRGKVSSPAWHLHHEPHVCPTALHPDGLAFDSHGVL